MNILKKFFKMVFGNNDNNECYDPLLLKAVLDSNNQQIERLDEIMAAINNLQDALARLSAATDSAVTVLNTVLSLLMLDRQLILLSKLS